MNAETGLDWLGKKLAESKLRDEKIISEEGKFLVPTVQLKRYTVYGHSGNIHLVAKYQGKIIDISAPADKIGTLLGRMASVIEEEKEGR